MTKKRLEFKAKIAMSLVGEPLETKQFKDLVGKSSSTKSGYHMNYEPSDIFAALGKMRPEIIEKKKLRGGLPPIICSHVSKGGTGKSSIISNVAVILAAMGFSVALIDGDPQASATTIYGIDSEDSDLKTLRDLILRTSSAEEVAVKVYENANLDLYPSDQVMNRLERELSSERGREFQFRQYLSKDGFEAFSKYDFILVDTNPGTTILNFNLMLSSNLILGVVGLDGLSLKALDGVGSDIEDIYTLTNHKIPVLFVPNNYNPAIKHSRVNLESLSEKYGEIMSKSVIPTYAGFGRQVVLDDFSQCCPVFVSEPNSNASSRLVDLAVELRDLFYGAEKKSKISRAIPAQ